MNLKIFALVLATLMGISAKTIAQTWDRSAPGDFQGRYLVSVSDADMLASAYVDGKLGSREGKDGISVIPLTGKQIRDLRAYETEVSNW
ncbi:hypothetical protein [Nostoc sp.]|uniref:hypothetical protein n=1 Tax=Nostoc sp. TaxID=1180 RepID=UPI002FF94660